MLFEKYINFAFSFLPPQFLSVLDYTYRKLNSNTLKDGANFHLSSIWEWG